MLWFTNTATVHHYVTKNNIKIGETCKTSDWIFKFWNENILKIAQKFNLKMKITFANVKLSCEKRVALDNLRWPFGNFFFWFTKPHFLIILMYYRNKIYIAGQTAFFFDFLELLISESKDCLNCLVLFLLSGWAMAVVLEEDSIFWKREVMGDNRDKYNSSGLFVPSFVLSSLLQPVQFNSAQNFPSHRVAGNSKYRQINNSMGKMGRNNLLVFLIQEHRHITGTCSELIYERVSTKGVLLSHGV